MPFSALLWLPLLLLAAAAHAGQWVDLLVRSNGSHRLRLEARLERGDWLGERPTAGGGFAPVELAVGQRRLLSARSSWTAPTVRGYLLVSRCRYRAWERLAVVHFESPWFYFFPNRFHLYWLTNFEHRAEMSDFPKDGPLGSVTFTVL